MVAATASLVPILSLLAMSFPFRGSRFRLVTVVSDVYLGSVVPVILALLLNPSTGYPRPVSYTHLDVYKRQGTTLPR